MSATNAPQGSIRHRWDTLHHAKGDLLTRSEQYAAWTLPVVFPPESFGSLHDTTLSNDSLGARGVNSMANKVVTTLFRMQGTFFRLRLDEDQREQLNALSKDSKKADIGDALNKIEDVFNSTERKAMDRLNMVQFRDKAVDIAKLLLVTGNALQYTPEDGPVQVYSVRDYCVVRDAAGTVIEIVTRDQKAFETFSPEVQMQLRNTRQYQVQSNQYEDRSPVTIYTQIKLKDHGKFRVKQAADLVDLSFGEHEVLYPKETLPWLPLTWNLSRGQDYGTGLVQDYAGAFHSIEVLTQNILNIAGIMGDIKWLVNPSSLIDVETLNRSPSGSYHSGKEGDITTPQMNKHADASFIQANIDKYTQQVSQAFMLNTGMVRDAERVTAEEIRMIAQELENAHGGVYSRLAHQWQTPLANILLDQIGFDGSDWNVTPKIVTGLDNLSRAGEMDNLRLWVGDLAMLEAIPEDIRRVINPLKYAGMCGRNRQVDWETICFSDQELAEQQEREMQQQQAMMQAQATANVQQKAGEAAVEQE